MKWTPTDDTEDFRNGMQSVGCGAGLGKPSLPGLGVTIVRYERSDWDGPTYVGDGKGNYLTLDITDGARHNHTVYLYDDGLWSYKHGSGAKNYSRSGIIAAIKSAIADGAMSGEVTVK